MESSRQATFSGAASGDGRGTNKSLDLRHHADGVTRLSLTEQAYVALKRAILDLTIAPGSPITEAQLAASLRMSKSPIRAALVNLQRDGLVVISPFKGTIVSELRLRDIQDMFEVRLLLEPYVAERVTPLLDADDFAAIEAILADGEAAVEARDYPAFLTVNARFHGYFIDRLGNRFIVGALALMALQLQRARSLTVTERPEQLELLAEHRQIFEAMRRREAEAAAANMKSHISRFIEGFVRSAKVGGADWLKAEVGSVRSAE